MFYSQFILAKKGPLGTIWIAAHLERKLRKNQVADTDIGVSVDSILFPEVPIALRLSSHLLLGVVRIYSRKVGYLFDDCSEALLKVKQAFRSTAVDLPPEESKAPYHSITLPETFELDDFELPENEIFQGNYVDHHVSSREQITLQDTLDGVVYSTSKFGLDERFGDGDTSGLDLDEELFLDKVAAAGDASVSADPQSSVEPMTPLKQDEHHEAMAANSESMIDGFDGGDGDGDGDADFMDHAPCTPGLAEEPNLSNIQETSACEDHLATEDRHTTEYAVKGNSENLSSEINLNNLENSALTGLAEGPNLSNIQETSACEDRPATKDHHSTEYALKGNSENLSSEINLNNGSKILETSALAGGVDADNVHSVALKENGYHLGSMCDKQLEQDGQLPPRGVAIDPVLKIEPALPSGPSSADLHQTNPKSSDLDCADEIVAATDSQTNGLKCGYSGMYITDAFHSGPPLPNGISSVEEHDVSVLNNICHSVPEDTSQSNQRSHEAVSNSTAIPGNLKGGFNEVVTGVQAHFLNRCNANQLDVSTSSCEHVVNHEQPSYFSGFQPPETSRVEASQSYFSGFQPTETSRVDSGFQPRETSRVDTGFQPPETSRVEASQSYFSGFQPPETSRVDAGFQPRETSRVDAGFQPPETSRVDASQSYFSGFHPPETSRVDAGFQPPETSRVDVGFQPPATSRVEAPQSYFSGFQPPETSRAEALPSHFSGFQAPETSRVEASQSYFSGFQPPETSRVEASRSYFSGFQPPETSRVEASQSYITGFQQPETSRPPETSRVEASQSYFSGFQPQESSRVEAPQSYYSGFQPPETSRVEASPSLGNLEQISKMDHMKGPVSFENFQKDHDKSNYQVNNMVQDRQMENMSGSAASALPAPEKILSRPGGGLVEFPHSIFSEASPGYLMGIDEAGSNLISGKKRSYTESTLTELSLNSAESSRMVRSKRTAGSIPDDNDLLSSILVGRNSSALKLKPTPTSEITSSKRPRSAARMSASKKRVLMDDVMVLHGDMIRQQLINANDIRRLRKKAPCTHAEISVMQKQLLEDEIFREALLTGVSVELAYLHRQTYDLRSVKVSSADASCSRSGMVVDPQLTSEYAENPISNLEERGIFNEPHDVTQSGKEGTNAQNVARDVSLPEAVIETTVPTEIEEFDKHDKRLNSESSHISNLEEQRGMLNEPRDERQSEKEGTNAQYVARDVSLPEAVVDTTVPTEIREFDEHDKRLDSDASLLQPDSLSDVAVATGSCLEPSDNAAEIGPQGTCVSGAKAAEAIETASAAEVLLCSNDVGLDGDGDGIAGLPQTDSFNEPRREDAFIIAEGSFGLPNCALAAQLDTPVENLNNDIMVNDNDWQESNYVTSEAKAGTETSVGGEVMLEATQVSATVEAESGTESKVEETVLLEASQGQDGAPLEATTNVEKIVVENDTQSFADKDMATVTERHSTDASYEELNMDMLDHSVGAREYPCQQDDFSYSIMGADQSDANLGDLNEDLYHSAAENDTGFLNFDDDDDDYEAEAADDYVPDADATRITENSGWSSRTRAVSKYLQTLFLKESEHGRKSLSMDSLLVGKTRKEASRMFFETLVLKTRDYIHVEQVIPFDDITIMPRMKLMKSDF